MVRGSTWQAVFVNWVEHQDRSALELAIAPRTWAVFLPVSFLGVAALCVLPGVRETFDLPLAEAMLCLLPSPLAWLAYLIVRPLQRGWVRLAYLMLIPSVYMQEVTAALLSARSAPTGAAVFCAMLLLGTVLDGFRYRSDFRHPFVAVCTVLAGLTGIAVARSPHNVSLLLATLPMGAFASMFLGATALQQRARQQERLQVVDALHSQTLAEQFAQLRRLTSTIDELMGTQHDARNALAVAMLNANFIRRYGEATGSLPPKVAQTAQDLYEAIERLRDLLDAARVAGRQRLGDRLQSVAVVPLLHTVAGVVGRRFPTVTLEVLPDEDGATAVLSDGATTLHRVLENLLCNACEGDGTRGARRVQARVRHDDSDGRLVVTITDDGPGFPPERLQRGIQVFATTKRHGTGLGLFTSERLLWASGAELICANRDEGGAQVELRLLPRAPE